MRASTLARCSPCNRGTAVFAVPPPSSRKATAPPATATSASASHRPRRVRCLRVPGGALRGSAIVAPASRGCLRGPTATVASVLGAGLDCARAGNGACLTVEAPGSCIDAWAARSAAAITAPSR